MDILALLQPIEDSLSKTTLRQMSRVILAMLAMTGRVTMLGLSRWAGDGGSYRSIQRFYHTAIPWAQVYWRTGSFFLRVAAKGDPQPILLCGLIGQCKPTAFLSLVR